MTKIFRDGEMIKSIEWLDGSVRFLDQTKLPIEELYTETTHPEDIAEAILKLRIRGAPLIGIAAAYGVALAASRSQGKDDASFLDDISRAVDMLSSTRPTAVNLSWALGRMKQKIERGKDRAALLFDLIGEAKKIHSEDIEMCASIGQHGSTLIPENAAILTHCNTGALATGGAGTAQSVITTSRRQGKNIIVFADETRPLLQGARLTMWELLKEGIDARLITDNAAASLMQKGMITLAITGADRIARNGDTANKIGTYGIAVNARHHGVPFYIAAPTSSIDPRIKSGSEIPIEERDPEEVTIINGRRIAPLDAESYCPAFDVTPAELITAIVTDRGVFYPPFEFSDIK